MARGLNRLTEPEARAAKPAIATQRKQKSPSSRDYSVSGRQKKLFANNAVMKYGSGYCMKKVVFQILYWRARAMANRSVQNCNRMILVRNMRWGIITGRNPITVGIARQWIG